MTTLKICPLTAVLIATGKNLNTMLQLAEVLPHASPPNTSWLDLVNGLDGRDPRKDFAF